MHREILIIIAVYQQQQQPMTKRTRSASVTKAGGAAIAAIMPGLSPASVVAGSSVVGSSVVGSSVVGSSVVGSSVVGSSVVGWGSGLATTNDIFIPNWLAYNWAPLCCVCVCYKIILRVVPNNSYTALQIYTLLLSLANTLWLDC